MTRSYITSHALIQDHYTNIIIGVPQLINNVLRKDQTYLECTSIKTYYCLLVLRVF